MPESKGRSKPSYTPPKRADKAKDVPSSQAYKIVMFGLMLLGLIWIVTYYISGRHEWPVPQIGRWNLGAGFALVMAGFLMTTRWR